MNFCWFDGSTKASFQKFKIILSCKTWHFQSFLIRCFNRGVRPAGLPDRRLWEPVCQVTVLKKSFFSDYFFIFFVLFVCFAGTSLPGDSFEKSIFSDWFFFFLFVCFAGTSLAGDSFALEKYFWRLIFIFLCTFCLFCGNQFARWQFWRFFFNFLVLQYVWCVWVWSGSFFEHGADQMLS